MAVSSSFSSSLASMKSMCFIVTTGLRPGAGLSVRVLHSLNCLIILTTVCCLIFMPSS